jgi:hypothetical protein
MILVLTTPSNKKERRYAGVVIMLKWFNTSIFHDCGGNVLYCHHPDEPSWNNWVLEIHLTMQPIGALHFQQQHMDILNISMGGDYVL